MCTIDWSALGTWAAVLLALAIAIGDKVSAYFRRQRASKILAILSQDELAVTRIRLEDIHKEINPNEVQWVYEAMLHVNEHMRTDLKALGDRLKMPVIDQAIERLPDLDSKLALSLTRTAARVRSVAFGALDPAKTPPGENFPNSAEFCTNLREEVAAALASVDESFSIGHKIIGI